MKTKRIPKVKINAIDLKEFLTEQLTIDPYWDDLYNPPEKPIKKRKRNH